MFADDLNRATIGCIHFLEVSKIPAAPEISKLGLHVAEINARNIRTKADLLSAIATALSFPKYFGHNWDALADCLGDLEWISAKGYVLVIRNADQLWHHAAKLAGQLVEIWLGCDEYWLQQKTPFHLIFEIA